MDSHSTDDMHLCDKILSQYHLLLLKQVQKMSKYHQLAGTVLCDLASSELSDTSQNCTRINKLSSKSQGKPTEDISLISRSPLFVREYG